MTEIVRGGIGHSVESGALAKSASSSAPPPTGRRSAADVASASFVFLPVGPAHRCHDVPMDASALRELQAPLKQRYRDEPATAHTPVGAFGTFESPGITCAVSTWSGITRAGLHPATGGDGSDSCSADMLLQALLACAGVTMRSVATAMGIDIVSAELSADGMFDVQGTLGLSRDVPVGVQDIHVVAVLRDRRRRRDAGQARRADRALLRRGPDAWRSGRPSRSAQSAPDPHAGTSCLTT